MEKTPDRRRFLKSGSLLAGLAFTCVGIANSNTLGAETTELAPKDLHAYGERSRFESSLRSGALGTWPQPTSPPDYHKDFGFRTPLQDSVGYVTPPALHYIVSHGYDPPNINPQEHQLLSGLGLHWNGTGRRLCFNPAPPTIKMSFSRRWRKWPRFGAFSCNSFRRPARS